MSLLLRGNFLKIKKTERHHGLKAVVCGRRSFFGLRKPSVFEVFKNILFLTCSRSNRTLKGAVFVKLLDIINKRFLN
jgi:hypothetical protein